MDSSSALIQQRLAASVQESLALLLYDNARFLCERLVAACSTESNLCLLALCYYHCNQAYRSYHLLKGLQGPQSRYLFAVSCMQLGKVGEARDALCRGGLQVPNGAAGHYLLGRASRLTGRITDAKEHFAQALRLDPLLWSAYEELCALGADDHAAEVCSEARAAAAATAPAGGAGPRQHGMSAPPPPFAAFTPLATSLFASGAGSGNAPMATCTPGPGPGPAPPLDVPSLGLMLARGGGAAATHLPTAAAAEAPGAARTRSAAGGGKDPVVALFADWPTPVPGPGAGAGFGAGDAPGLRFFTPASSAAAAAGPAPPHTEQQLRPAPLPPGWRSHLPDSSLTAAAEDQTSGHMGLGHAHLDPGSCSYETPQAAAAPLRPPAPPQKDEGVFGKQQQQQHAGPAAASSSEEPGLPRQRGAGGGGGGGGGSGSSSRLLEDGKVRKVSGRLFQEPSRRSTRLAAKDSGGGGGGSGGRGAAGGGGVMAAALRPSFHQCQNLPDPEHPPAAPGSARHLQAYVDAKLRGGGGTPAAATAGGAGTAPGPLGVEAAQGQARSATALVLALLLPLLEGCRHLSMYRSREALQALSRLPRQQYNTAWVMCQVGRAHFEVMDYPAAVAAFESARSLDRYRLEGMDMYSTALWHMRRECELSFLAQEVIAVDRLAPQAWCVLGNFCSLQKEHDSAIQLFQRAVQLNPSFAYAYTLAGHEYFSNEDYDKSLLCYRSAVRLDPRHYNAMYGVGQIYLRQEKFDLALVHFKSASHINPRSSLLHCYIAMTLHRQGMHERALSKLNEAISIDPKNPLARFEKASVLMAMDCNSAALAELQQLSQLSPGEPSVYFQMGRLYKKLGDLERAQQQLEKALSFKSSSADTSLIQTAIEKLGVDEDEDVDEL